MVYQRESDATLQYSIGSNIDNFSVDYILELYYLSIVFKSTVLETSFHNKYDSTHPQTGHRLEPSALTDWPQLLHWSSGIHLGADHDHFPQWIQRLPAYHRITHRHSPRRACALH